MKFIEIDGKRYEFDNMTGCPLRVGADMSNPSFSNRIKPVPKRIRAKMHRAALLYARANALMAEIEDWFFEHGALKDYMRDGGGNGLEEIEYGHDVTDGVCERYEAGEYIDKREII